MTSRRRFTGLALAVALSAAAAFGLGPLLASPSPALGYFEGSAVSSPMWIYSVSNAAPVPISDINVPYTTVRLDSTPSAEATAAYVDTGALGQTGASKAGVAQPQYSTARYPGSPRDAQAGAVDQGDPLGVVRIQAAGATAKASETNSEADSSVFSLSSGAPSGAASAAAVFPQEAFAALIRAVNSARAGAGHPAFGAQQSEGTAGASKLRSHSRVWLEGQKAFALAESSTEGLDLGGGLMRVDSVRSRVLASSEGTVGRAEPSLEVSGASIGGVPVRITSDGVEVAANPLPAGPKDAKPFADSLNQALGAAGWQVRLLGTEDSSSGARGKAVVRGVEFRWVAPMPSGLPSFSYDLVVGRAEATAYGGRLQEVVEGVRLEGETGAVQEWPPVSGGVPSDWASQPPVGESNLGAGSPSAASALRAPSGRSNRWAGLVVALYGFWQLSTLAAAALAIHYRKLAG
ncbi:MAG: hypothetical protein WDA71_08100 [Actinomycetota bacterium]